ncbi:YEATS-like protein [Encephalitozoon hellem]|uniref:Protein AF-9 homolog n=1 Tax=Encephalitozoon hellem TaxID=27973 RepID=A0A9Q9C3J5_ENCHE|nr:transcription initiation factor IIF auxiliary subunit [Encephalitozoon hellem ATCC 50504]AFM98049.1 transcription initiation factor IIF auxiliary subunit [Encephalitozoon hellem ATCC 50504]KAG5859423.1 YEATS-like protein [Encephalitozoon hellem]UTX42855.1 YEATS domain-containing protein [Encephalitozoon hellem]WEL38314.1 YEATS domain-containing protein [Encephalitozoon hellem]|eukprot:XP_003887030.1 transcription initiation factor IIF auxiliary subunit [Encephalitozoon hellem ATCC 50504]
MEGYSSCRVIIGNEARVIPEEERAIPELTHEWKAYVKAPPEIVKRVEFKLHESFSNRLVSKEYPFEVIERGWGEFSIQMKIVLFNGEKIATSHFLQLHGDSDIIVNERIDEIVFKGSGNESTILEEEEEEYERIETGIVNMLEKFKEINE